MALSASVQSEKVWLLLAKIQDGEQDFSRLLLAAQRIFAADGASLFLEKENSGVFGLMAAVGLSESIPSDAVVRSAEGLAGKAIASKRPLLIGDTDEPLVDAASLNRKDELGASMVIPLILPSQKPVGVLNFARKSSDTPFTSNDLSQAASVASSLALIFENARLVRSLRQSHTTLSKVLQSFDIGVCVFDENRQLVTHNRPAKKWLDKSPDRWDAFLGSLPSDLALLAQIGEHAVTHDPGSLEAWQGECEFGDEYLRVNVIRLAGGGLAWTVQNLTEHVKAQRETNRIQRLAEIGEMTASVAHDIRNPLTSISGAARMIKEMPERSAEFADIIEEEAAKLRDLCTEFLEFSKPLHLHPSGVNMKLMLCKLKDQHRDAAADRSVSLVVTGPESARPVCADQAKLEQAARNLIINAIQACPAGGRVELSAESDGFKVTDNGSGITDEYMKRMFTPFSTTKTDGTGLGLCSVKKIIDAHGGVITVERLTQGTSFYVRLPESAA